MEKIFIAQIIKPQGVHGDVKIALFADDDFNIKNLKNVYIDDEQYKVEKTYFVGGGYAIKLSGIEDRNTAELYRNKKIMINRDELLLKPGTYLMQDIIGKNVLVSGNNIGKIVDIQNFGSADVFYISGEKQILCSHKEGLIENIDDKNIVLNEKIFAEVSVYED